MSTKNIINITHTDMDGYGCSFFLREYYSDVKSHDGERYTFTAFNCEYHQLKESITDLKTLKPGTIDILYITDLNINRETAELLTTVKSRFKKLVFIDHHKTSQETKDRLESLKADGIDVDVIIDLQRSSTELVYDYLKPKKYEKDTKTSFYTLHKYRDLKRYINAWDMHDMSSEFDFERGQLFNDFFSELMNLLRYIPKMYVHRLVDTFFKTISSSVWANDEITSATVDRTLRANLPYEFINKFWEDPNRSDMVAYISNIVVSLGFRQAISLVVAFIISFDKFGVEVVDLGGERNVKVMFLETLGLPASIVHHLVYTLGYCDIIVTRSKEGYSIRQNSRKIMIDCGALAYTYGGGGRDSTSGFITKETLDKETFIRRLKTCLIAA